MNLTYCLAWVQSRAKYEIPVPWPVSIVFLASHVPTHPLRIEIFTLKLQKICKSEKSVHSKSSRVSIQFCYYEENTFLKYSRRQEISLNHTLDFDEQIDQVKNLKSFLMHTV